MKRISFHNKLAVVLQRYTIEHITLTPERVNDFDIESKQDYKKHGNAWRATPYDRHFETIEMIAETPNRLVQLLYEVEQDEL